MGGVLLRDAMVLDTMRGTLVGPHDVRIVSNRIREIGPTGMRVKGDNVVNLRGRTLMPGLCDAHVHVCNPINSFADLARLSPTYVGARALRILERMLLRGFTTVRDAGGADFGLALAIREGHVAGPRLLYSGKALSQTGGHGDMRGRGEDYAPTAYTVPSLGRLCDGVPAVREAARDEIRKGASQVKIMASGGAGSPNDPIHFTQFSEEEIRASVEEAAAADTYVMAHAYTPRAVNRALRQGVRSIEHGTLADQESIGLFLKHDAFMVPTLCVVKLIRDIGPSLGFSQQNRDKLEGFLERGLQTLSDADAAGVKIAYGTDLSGDLHDYQSTEFEVRAEVQSPVQIIRGATIIAAELFQMAGQIGIVAEDAFADLIVIDGNPLENIALLQEQGRHMPLIMRDGQLFKNDLH
jgi:imidazolonepropionase-like amidohydrolase